jgi:S1-C subfamily serine protease
MDLNKILFILLPVLLYVSGCASSAVIKQTESKQAIDVPVNTESRPIQFKKIVVKLDRGEDIGSIQSGLLCVPQADLIWRGGKIDVSNDDFTEVFREELTKANYEVIGSTDELFEDPSDWKAEYLIAGLVNEMQANICFPWGGFGNWTSGKGEAYMKVNWQIYSRLNRKVVYETTTEGSSKVDDSSATGPADVFLNAFSIATKNLLSDKGFHDLIVNTNQPTQQAGFSILTLVNKPLFGTSFQENINYIRSGVATVFAGDGHGSGFFISGDGYMLTNEHVVGGAKFVKVKLTTGREILGEVIRTNSARDVALIKTEESNMNALPLRNVDINIGEEVFAIGSPLDEEFSTTVSKGVVSSYGVIDGKRFIQSDVNVLPGNSGGPLIDSNGNVVGIAVEGVFIGNAPAGLNFFIPINEALNSLKINKLPSS